MARVPAGFLWGASTSSYQVEGGNRASAFWDWESRMGWERSGEACRSWELFEEDLACLKALGLNAYRFSVEWSRVEPEPGRFDAAALSRYAQWVRRLSEEGIRPFVCQHHFSEPAWLLREHPRGWLDPAVPDRFLRFASRAVPALAESVSDWIVFNEPMTFLLAAYGGGMFPPGRRFLLGRAARIESELIPSLARAHREVHALIKAASPSARVGLAQYASAIEPSRPGDEGAARRWDRFMHREFVDRVRGSLDFLGVNYYTRIFVSRCRLPGAPFGALPGYAEFEKAVGPRLFKLLGGRRDGGPRTAMGWEVVPEGLAGVLESFWRDYRLPLLVTENGLAPAPGAGRAEFLRGHLAALGTALEAGVDLRGYFHWSLLDNWEWGSYAPRFGLFTRERRPAEGSEVYASAARTGELPVG